MPDLSSLDTTRNRILSILLLCLVLVIWQASPILFKIPAFILPSASAVAVGLWRGLGSGLYLYHGAVTLFEVLAGFALGGLLGLTLGVAVALNRRFAYFIYPYIIMPYADAPAFLASLRDRDTLACAALEFCVLTAARSGEVLGMRWNEADLDNAIWSLPKERMKAGRPHRVPLPRRAVAILRKLERTKGNGEFVFPGHGRTTAGTL